MPCGESFPYQVGPPATPSSTSLADGTDSAADCASAGCQLSESAASMMQACRALRARAATPRRRRARSLAKENVEVERVRMDFPVVVMCEAGGAKARDLRRCPSRCQFLVEFDN